MKAWAKIFAILLVAILLTWGLKGFSQKDTIKANSNITFGKSELFIHNHTQGPVAEISGDTYYLKDSLGLVARKHIDSAWVIVDTPRAINAWKAMSESLLKYYGNRKYIR